MHHIIDHSRKIYWLFLLPALLFVTVTAIIRNSAQEASAVAAAHMTEAGPVLVIDAGHGGLDGGAVSVTGMAESGINLSIALKAQALGRLFGREPVMTRTEEVLNYPPEAVTIHEKKVWDQKQRVSLINSTENAVLLSIHQNKFPDKRPKGTQVFYGTAEGSKRFGEIAHENLSRCLCPENRRVAAPISDRVFLMKSISCPAILAKCGFLSNPEEAAWLNQEDYQKRMALILYASFLQYIGEGPEEYK